MKKKLCYIIPCLYTKQSGFHIFNCVKSVRKQFSKVDIYVVDSGSSDTSYLNVLKKKYDIIPLDVKNKNFPTGALWYVYESTKDQYENYFLLHDSTIIKQRARIDEILQEDYKVAPITTYEKWSWPKKDRYDDKSRSSAWPRKKFRENELEFPKNKKFLSILGPMFMISKEVLDEISNTTFYNIRPKIKYHSICMEILWAYTFQQLGYKENMLKYSIMRPELKSDGRKIYVKDSRYGMSDLNIDTEKHRCKTHEEHDFDNTLQKFWATRQ